MRPPLVPLRRVSKPIHDGRRPSRVDDLMGALRRVLLRWKGTWRR